MLSPTDTMIAYTPEQVSEMLQLSKNTIYDLIDRGEIGVKKFGKVYRIPAISLSFLFTGMDEDIYRSQLEDEKNLQDINNIIRDTRKKVWTQSKSF